MSTFLTSVSKAEVFKLPREEMCVLMAPRMASLSAAELPQPATAKTPTSKADANVFSFLMALHIATERPQRLLGVDRHLSFRDFATALLRMFLRRSAAHQDKDV